MLYKYTIIIIIVIAIIIVIKTQYMTQHGNGLAMTEKSLILIYHGKLVLLGFFTVFHVADHNPLISHLEDKFDLSGKLLD